MSISKRSTVISLPSKPNEGLQELPRHVAAPAMRRHAAIFRDCPKDCSGRGLRLAGYGPGGLGPLYPVNFLEVVRIAING
jgi:hypothetical protein